MAESVGGLSLVVLNDDLVVADELLEAVLVFGHSAVGLAVLGDVAEEGGLHLGGCGDSAGDGESKEGLHLGFLLL